MPRGRPPIARTKEEALAARREQVRKNVQAYRKRKQAGVTAQENTTDVDGECYTFAVEDLGHCNSHAQSRQRGSPEDAAPQHDTEQQEEILPWSSLRQRQSIQLYLKPGQPNATSYPGCLALLPPSINSGSISLQQFTSNVASNLCSDGAFSGSHWFQIVPSLVNRNRTLDLSIQALCLLQVGHVDRDNDILHKSITLYNAALQRLRLSLLRPANEFKVEIFAATLVLGSFELLQGTNSQGREWMQHLEGGTTYLNMFPSLDMCTLTHQLSFHYLETICIFDALGSRKPSCFSTSHWWRICVDRFGGKAYGPLLRMLTSLPEVLEQCDVAVSQEAHQVTSQEWTRLLQLCWRLEEAFLDWSSRTLGAATFTNIFVARLYLLYWPSMILLYDSMIAILRKFCPNHSMSDQLSISIAQSLTVIIAPQAYMGTSHTFAESILSSVPLCLDPKYGVIGKSIILLPLYVARNHMRHIGNDEQAESCDEWLGKLGQKMMRFGVKVKKGL